MLQDKSVVLKIDPYTTTEREGREAISSSHRGAGGFNGIIINDG